MKCETCRHLLRIQLMEGVHTACEYHNRNADPTDKACKNYEGEQDEKTDIRRNGLYEVQDD